MATEPASNVGKWNRWYEGATEPRAYGSELTYWMGAEFLSLSDAVEDWGCGLGFLRQCLGPHIHYTGIDGSQSDFADKIEDLTTYQSQTPGLFMRHVLEHNPEWEVILQNAMASFTERLMLVLFTPLQAETHELAFAEDPGVPDIGFALGDITKHFEGTTWSYQTYATATQYGQETVFRVKR